MKRILLACFLLTAVFTLTSVTKSSAQAITTATFMVKVNQMDTYIGAGNMTAAQTTWNDIHADMLTVLAVTKNSIHSAATPADVTYYTGIMTNQRTIYFVIWPLHTDLLLNRVALHTNLTSFGATIY